MQEHLCIKKVEQGKLQVLKPFVFEVANFVDLIRYLLCHLDGLLECVKALREIAERWKGSLVYVLDCSLITAVQLIKASDKILNTAHIGRLVKTLVRNVSYQMLLKVFAISFPFTFHLGLTSLTSSQQILNFLDFDSDTLIKYLWVVIA